MHASFLKTHSIKKKLFTVHGANISEYEAKLFTMIDFSLMYIKLHFSFSIANSRCETDVEKL